MFPDSSTTQVLEFLNIPICCLEANGGFAQAIKLKKPKTKRIMSFLSCLTCEKSI